MANKQANRPKKADRIPVHHHPPAVTDAIRLKVEEGGKLTFRPSGKGFVCNQTEVWMKPSQLEPYRRQFWRGTKVKGSPEIKTISRYIEQRVRVCHNCSRRNHPGDYRCSLCNYYIAGDRIEVIRALA